MQEGGAEGGGAKKKVSAPADIIYVLRILYIYICVCVNIYTYIKYKTGSYRATAGTIDTECPY